jgi:hypothetical protein
MVNNTSEPQQNNDRIELFFALKDKVNGEPVTPSNLNAHMLSEFVNEVTTFVRGSKLLDLKLIKTEVKLGSFAVSFSGPESLLNEAAKDYEVVATSSNISNLDRVRRKVVLQWQRHAHDEEFRSYVIRLNSSPDAIVITSASEYRVDDAVWAEVETYVYGRVFDLGGKSHANVHVELENGGTIKIESDSELLATDKVNRVYQNELLRIRAKKNLATGTLTDERLISFEKYNPEYDEDEQAEIESKGRSAWAGINPTEWVEALRGDADAV